MGSRSSSATSSNQTTNQTSTVTNENISGIEDSLVLNDVDNAVFETTDFGTVEKAFAFASEVVENQQSQLSDTLKSINAANAVSADLDASTRAETITTVSKYVAYALIAVSAVYLLSRMRKK
jgi:hypothetical protein